MSKRYRANNNLISGLIGTVLFFLVISVLYIIITFERVLGIKVESILQGIMPFIVLTGFFIFLVAAMLLALSLFKAFNNRK